MRGGRLRVSCLGVLSLLAVNPVVRLPDGMAGDVRPRVAAIPAGTPAWACTPIPLDCAIGAMQQAAGHRPRSKPNVYVKVAFVEGVEHKLDQDDPEPARTNEQWLDHISDEAVKWLQGWGEGVDVIPHEQKVLVDDMPETPEPENGFSDIVPGEYVFRRCREGGVHLRTWRLQRAQGRCAWKV